MFVIPKGMLINNVDPQKGGEANFTLCMKGLSSLCTSRFLDFFTEGLILEILYMLRLEQGNINYDMGPSLP